MNFRQNLKYINLLLLIVIVGCLGCLRPNIFFDEDDIKEVRFVTHSYSEVKGKSSEGKNN